MPTITGTTADDTLIGTEEADVIFGQGGNDTVYGRGGDDVIEGGDGNDVIEGGDGGDTIRDGAGNDTVFAQEGNDTLFDGEGDDILNGGNGDDLFVLSVRGNNRLDGGPGFDTLDLTAIGSGLTVTFEGPDNGLQAVTGFAASGRLYFSRTFGVERLISLTSGNVTINLEAPFIILGAWPTDMEIITGSGSDFLRGGSGRDLLRAGAGSDTLFVGAGDSAYGEAGDDVLNYRYDSAQVGVPTVIDGGEGVDELRLTSYDGRTALDLRSGGLPNAAAFTNIENLNVIFSENSTIAYAGSIVGTEAANRIHVVSRKPEGAPTDAVAIDGGGGNDVITVFGARATIDGGDGNDVISGSSLADTLRGGAGNDVIEVSNGDDTVDGGAGIDQLNFINYGHVVDMVAGTAVNTFNGVTTTVRFSGIENLSLASGPDLVRGDANNNIIWGGLGDDTLRGGGGDDTIDGGVGADSLFGDMGEDVIIASGNDIVNGGDGTDTLRVGGRYVDYRITVENGVTVLSRTNERIEVIEVERFEFADYTVASSLTATRDIFGTSGAELLTGAAGGDRIIAGDGDDFLIGDAAGDILDGGSGVDTAGYFSLVRSYAVTRGANSFTTVAGGVEGGTDLLTSIERLSFLDGTLDLNPNGAAAQIFRLYDAALDRAPDQAGLSGWVGRLAAGTTLNQAAQAFATAPEFVARYGNLSNEDFVRTMYRFSLNREGDAFGISQWKAQLDSGVSRGEVLLAFSESVEHRNITAAAVAQGLFVQDDRTIAVARLYDAAFDRVPDQGGIAYWRGTLNDGGSLFSIANAFVSSREFQDRYGALNNTQFIDQLYRFTLNREADAFGRQVWVDRLNSGTTRAEMVVIFSESVEHVNLTAPLWQGGVRYEGYVEPGSALAETGKGLDDAFVLPAVFDDIAFDAGVVDDTALTAPDTGALVQPDLAAFDVADLVAIPNGHALIGEHHHPDWM